jgi:homoaconitase/3-isopropylmalate dehydratase large subunit
MRNDEARMQNKKSKNCIHHSEFCIWMNYGYIDRRNFSRKAGRTVKAGETLLLDVDYIMSHDNTTPLALKASREIGKPILDKNRIVIHLDHAYHRPARNVGEYLTAKKDKKNLRALCELRGSKRNQGV